MQEPKRSSLNIFSRPSFHQRHDVTILEDGERCDPVVLGWGKEREGKASIGKSLIEGAVDVEFGKKRLEDVAIEGRTGGEQDLTVRGPRNVFKPPPCLMERQPADRVVDHAAWQLECDRARIAKSRPRGPTFAVNDPNDWHLFVNAA